MEVKIFNGQSYIDIQPTRATFKDQEDCTRLYITQIIDTLVERATIYWELRTSPVEEQYNEQGEVTVSGNPGTSYLRRQYQMTNGDYEQWGTDNAYPFTILLNALNLKAL